MGMGQALSEETRYVNGLPLHASLLEYRVPTIAKSPPIEVHIVESHDPLGPFGPRKQARARLPASLLRWSMRSPTPSASTWTNCRSRPTE